MLVIFKLYFYCHPDIYNLLIIDSMIESSQNDYALNWNRLGTKTGPMLVGKSSCFLQEYGSFCLFIMFTCMSLRVLKFCLYKLLLLIIYSLSQSTSTSLIVVSRLKVGRLECTYSNPHYNKFPMHLYLPRYPYHLL